MPICRPDPDERAQAFRQLRSESDAVETCWALALRFKHFELEADSTARDVFDEEAYVSAPAAWPQPPETRLVRTLRVGTRAGMPNVIGPWTFPAFLKPFRHPFEYHLHTFS